MLYLETSARQGVNVDGAFTELASHIYNHYKLDRRAGEISEGEIKSMEAHGVKFGPTKPIISLSPSNAPSSNVAQNNGCC